MLLAQNGLMTWIKKMGLKRKDWEEVVEKCLKEYKLIETALKNMIIAAELQGVMFDKAMENLEKLPKEKKA